MGKSTRPVGIIGTGAVGSVLAASLRDARQPVMILGRTGRPRILRDCEAVFFCVKSADTKKAVASVKRVLAPDAVVVALQNGIGHARLMRRAFGPRRTVIGSAYFAASRDASGAARHNGGTLIRLAKNGSNSGALDLAERLLRRGGWKVELQSSEDRMLWSKLAFNAAANPLGALAGATNGELAADPALRHLMLAALKESLGLARAAGHPVSGGDAAGRLLRAFRRMPRQPNSMLQDLRAGRPTERRAILEPLLSAGRKHHRPAPILESFNRILIRLEKSR